jgi:hypothetical protein
MAVAVGDVQPLNDGGYGFTIKATNRPTFMVLDLVTRQFEAASTHRLRLRHWIFPPSDGPPPRKRTRERSGARP